MRHPLGWCPIHIAAINGDHVILSYLIQMGADVLFLFIFQFIMFFLFSNFFFKKKVNVEDNYSPTRSEGKSAIWRRHEEFSSLIR